MPTDISTTAVNEMSSISLHAGSFITDPKRTRQLWNLVSMSTVSAGNTKVAASPTLPFAPPLPGSARFALATLAPRGIAINNKPYAEQTPFAYFGSEEPPPARSRASHYQRISILRRATVWLELNNLISIARNYQAIVCDGNLSAEEWKLEALSSLLRSEGRVYPDPEGCGDDIDAKQSPFRLPVRLSSDSFTPDPVSAAEPRWEEPPLLVASTPSCRTAGSEVLSATAGKARADPSNSRSTATTRTKTTTTTTTTASSQPTAGAAPLATSPTISYWLWAGGFFLTRPLSSTSPSWARSPGWTATATTPTNFCTMNADELSSHTALRHRRACLPYLSIDVLADGHRTALQLGRERLAASGAVALWNRWRLAAAAATAESGSDALRHFGILLAGPVYEVWRVRPGIATTASDSGAGAWQGCSLAKLAGGSLTSSGQLAKLVDWINEIHCWGSTAYADACVEDMRAAAGRGK